jgi:hypothetical protein
VDAAVVALSGDRLAARGTSVTGAYALDWRLTTGPGFATRRLSVRLRGDDGERRLELTRPDDGAWAATRHAAGRDEALDLAGLGLGPGALDCDLALCPFTNTLPILRHGLGAGDGRTHDLVMAWVSVPDLSVHASPQAYTALAGPAGGAGATARVGFASEGFTATLVVDEHGFVVDYPGIATRLTARR